jgi:hypothetical protein
MTLTPGHFTNEQRKILRAVAMAYRSVMRAPSPSALTRADAARLAEERQKEGVAAAIAEYRRLSPFATGPLPSTPVAREWREGSSACGGGLVGTSLYWLPSGLTRLIVACRIGAK